MPERHDWVWHETGERRDTPGGRATSTQFYKHLGHRIADTIISGPRSLIKMAAWDRADGAHAR